MHAALWDIWAFAELGQQDRAASLYQMVNPIYHANTLEKARCYQVEPYVVAADVYSVPPYLGRGGWIWYTGSASWMYRVGLEAILGLRREGNRLHLKPCIPPDWPEYSIDYRFGDTIYHIHVQNPGGAYRTVSQVAMDGQALSKIFIPLHDDGKEHDICVTLR